ncbi:hypothetical protein V6Z05_18160 [Leptospira venezuelensis]|uniref:hypothetical protein n=1 Tax=Leptospira venezuelensis TaxID=1958811 RepID=UPI000A3AE9E9|nr:hypothetical protein [Leptospira venezuelensis]
MKPGQFLDFILSKLESISTADPFDRTPDKSDYLWYNTRLIPAIKKQKKVEWDTYRSMIEKWKKSEVQSRVESRRKEFNQYFTIEYFGNWINSLTSLLNLKGHKDLNIYWNEVSSVLFGISDSPYPNDNTFVSILSYGIENIFSLTEFQEEIVLVYHEFTNYLLERIKMGKEHGLLERDLDYFIKSIRTLKKKLKGERSEKMYDVLTSSILPEYLRVLYVRYIIGNEIHERKLKLKIKKLSKLDIGAKESALLHYRYLICMIYLGEWKEIRKFIKELEENPLKGWSRLWTGFLYFELGDYKNAYQSYREILQENHPIKERYLAVQALDLLSDRMEYGFRADQGLEDTLFQKQSWRELKFKVIEEARELGVLLDYYDFTENKNNLFRLSIARAGFDFAFQEKEEGINYYRESHPISLIYREFNKYWLNGMPTVNVDVEIVKKSLVYILSNPMNLYNILDLIMVLPASVDLKSIKINEKIQLFAWKYSSEWLLLQGELINRFRKLVENPLLLINTDSKREGSLINLQFRNISNFLRDSLSVFSRENFFVLLRIFNKLLKELDNIENREYSAEFEVIGDILSIVLSKLKIKDRAVYIEYIDPSRFFTLTGSLVLGRIQDFLNSDLWSELDKEYKNDLMNQIKINAEINPNYCFGFLPLFKSDKNQAREVVKIISEGLEQYRSRRIAELKENIVDKDFASNERFWRDEIESFEGKRSWLDIEFNEYLFELEEVADIVPFDLDTWIEENYSVVNVIFSSNLFEPLRMMLKSKKLIYPDNNIQRVINLAVKRMEEDFSKDRISDHIDDIYRSDIGLYYLRTRQYEEWMSLWGRVKRFNGYVLEAEDFRVFREYLEERDLLVDTSNGMYKRMLILFVQLKEKKDKLWLMVFMSGLISHAKKEIDGDRDYLVYAWNDSFIRERYVSIGISAIENLRRISNEDLNDFIVNCMVDLIDEYRTIYVDGSYSKLMRKFIEENIDLLRGKELLYNKAEKLIRKLSTLDFITYE